MRAKLWIHLCESTRELTWVGQGEQCNWCPVQELSCAELLDEHEPAERLATPQGQAAGSEGESQKQ
ncbi:hypothetical protein CTI14_01710 [Methylobacterium radiotolerans]|nr:hypothetical protein CTI14_01710 [Methylobacterium radiotolerans]